MDRDASSAGVRLGGLFSTSDIRILICYILSAINEPIPVAMMANTLHFEGIANGFEISDAVVALEKSGHIEAVNDSKSDYQVTNLGREVAKTLATSISYTVKDRAYTATMKMLSRFKNAQSTEFEITHENSHTYINCSIHDGNSPFFSVKLLVTDDDQAMSIKERFINDPVTVYRTVVEMLTNEIE